ncbi:MAG TPA: hypothetical protein VHM22_18560 [Bradyrhizobium sp.]|nr:hypothetical protein [Bradyrhizobium sp.]
MQLASSFEEWFNKVELGIRTRGADAKKIIQELNKLGADVQIGLPGQQLEQQITKAADVFTKLGIPVFDATGKVRGLTDAFGDFLDKFKDKSATEQLQLVRQALGRGFTDLIPLMRQGRDGMKAFFDELRGRGLDVSPFTQEVEEADKLHRALIRLDSAIKGIRKAFVLPFAKVFAPLVESLEQSLTSMKGQINDFAQSSAETLLAFAQDVKRVFQGQEPLTEAGRAFKIVADAMKVAVEALSLAFNALAAALQPIAGLLNGILGLNFDTRTYAIAAAVLYLTGVIPGLVAAFNLLRAVFLFFMANPIVAVFTALAAAGLIIYQNWDKIGPLFQTLWDELKEFGSQLYTDFVQPWVDAWDFVSQKYTESVESIKKDVQTVLDIFDGLITKAQVAANAVASVFGVDLGGSANYGGGSNYATGGLVSGPGGPTSDSVLARLSDGEYVMRAAAVKHWGPSFMAALNALRNPLGGYSLGGMVRSPRLLPRFAGGGMVTATTGDGVTVNLHFPGGAFALRGDKSIVQGLTREARRAGMLSAGRLPGVAVA